MAFDEITANTTLKPVLPAIRLSILLSSVLWGCSVCAAQSLPTEYTFTTINVSGANETIVTGINDQGLIVGEFGDIDLASQLFNPGSRGFIFDGQDFEIIEVPNAISTQPLGINNVGQVVGQFADQDGLIQGFLYDGEVFTTISAGEGVQVTATDINDSGTILAVTSTDGFFTVDGITIDDQGQTTPVAAPFATGFNFLSSINNAGQIVGTNFSITTSGFTIPGGPVQIDPNLNEAYFGINNSGIVVGGLAGVSDVGLILDPGSGESATIDLPDEGPTRLDEINDDLTIVGFFEDEQGRERGFIGVPLLPGDYNNDGVVNAADYTVWRDNLGAPAGTLPNDIFGGVIGIEHYRTFFENFGAGTEATPPFVTTAPVTVPVTVPEPAALSLMLVGMTLVRRPRC